MRHICTSNDDVLKSKKTKTKRKRSPSLTIPSHPPLLLHLPSFPSPPFTSLSTSLSPSSLISLALSLIPPTSCVSGNPISQYEGGVFGRVQATRWREIWARWDWMAVEISLASFGSFGSRLCTGAEGDGGPSWEKEFKGECGACDAERDCERVTRAEVPAEAALDFDFAFPLDPDAVVVAVAVLPLLLVLVVEEEAVAAAAVCSCR